MKVTLLTSVLFAICSGKKSNVFYSTNEGGEGGGEGMLGMKTGKGSEGQLQVGRGPTS